MPSLSEYIRSLKSYNPGITDKSIKIYLLKDGWNIDEIEKTFREINGVTPTPEISATSPIASAPLTQSAPISSSTSSSSPAATRVIEKQPEELITNTIPYPTFEQVQQKVQSISSNPPTPPSPAISVPTYTAAPAPVSVVTPASVPTLGPSAAQSPISISIPADNFGAPVPSLKPNFSYKDIMGDNPPSTTPAVGPAAASVSASSAVKESRIPVGWAEEIGNATKSANKASIEANNMSVGQIASTAIPTMTPAQAEAVARLRGAKMAGISESPLPQSSGTTQTQNQIPPTNSAYGSPAPIVTPVAAPTQSVKAQNSGGAVKMIIWLIVILGCIGGLGFAYIKYVHGVYLFVQAPFSKENFIEGFAKSIASVDTAAYEASMSFKTAPMEAGVVEVDFDKFPDIDSGSGLDDNFSPGYSSSLYDSSEDIMSMIPSDAKFSSSISGIYNKKGNSNDGKFGVKADYTGDGVSIAVDIESIKLADNFYVRVNTFPAFFMDLSTIKDKWISITEEDVQDSLGDYFSIFDIGSDDIGGTGDTDKKDLKKQYVAILEFANQKQVLEVIGEPVKIVGADKRVIYEYEVKPNLNNLIAFVEGLPAHLKSQFGDEAILQGNAVQNAEDLKELKSEKFAYYFNYFRDHTKTLVGVDTKGLPAYIDVFNKTAPKGNTLKKQLETNFRISLSNVNGNNDVVAPENPLPYIDAYSQVTGKSKDDILYEQQRSRILNIQSGIREYTRYSGTLPLTLEDLERSTADLVIASSTFKDIFKGSGDDDYFYRYQFSTSTRPIYGGSLKNAFSSQPGQNIVYKRISNSSYELVYDMKLPSVPKSSYTLMYEYGMGDYYGDKVTIFGLPFVNGVNTATEKDESIQAGANKKIDTDKDRLSNDLEIYIGTDPNKSDTDGDKKSDYEELRAGTNPKGAGNW